MKIAIATEGANVSAHFGRCENFTIVELDGTSAIKDKKVISTQGNQHAALPDYLAALGVQTVISGGMGSGASENLKKANITAITGVHGTVDAAINSFIKGELKPGEADCHGHEHGHEHHENHSCNCKCH